MKAQPYLGLSQQFLQQINLCLLLYILPCGFLHFFRSARLTTSVSRWHLAGVIGLPRFLLLFLSPPGDPAYPLCQDMGHYYTNHGNTSSQCTNIPPQPSLHSEVYPWLHSETLPPPPKKKNLELYLITYHRAWRSQTHPKAHGSQSLPLRDCLKARRTESNKVALLV